MLFVDAKRREGKPMNKELERMNRLLRRNEERLWGRKNNAEKLNINSLDGGYLNPYLYFRHIQILKKIGLQNGFLVTDIISAIRCIYYDDTVFLLLISNVLVNRLSDAANAGTDVDKTHALFSLWRRRCPNSYNYIYRHTGKGVYGYNRDTRKPIPYFNPVNNQCLLVRNKKVDVGHIWAALDAYYYGSVIQSASSLTAAVTYVGDLASIVSNYIEKLIAIAVEKNKREQYVEKWYIYDHNLLEQTFQENLNLPDLRGNVDAIILVNQIDELGEQDFSAIDVLQNYYLSAATDTRFVKFRNLPIPSSIGKLNDTELSRWINIFSHALLAKTEGISSSYWDDSRNFWPEISETVSHLIPLYYQKLSRYATMQE